MANDSYYTDTLDNEGKSTVRCLFNHLAERWADDDDKYSRTDLHFTGRTDNVTSGLPITIEVKRRQMDTTQFLTSILQDDKKQALEEEIAHGRVAFYACVYNDAVCVWNIGKVDWDSVEQQMLKCPWHSFNQADGKMMKKCWLLPFGGNGFRRYNKPNTDYVN